MNDKNRETSTIKQTFYYGKSKTVTVEVVKKKEQNKEKNIHSNQEKKKTKVSAQPRKKLNRAVMSMQRQ